MSTPEWRAANAERLREYKRAWRAANAERIREQRREARAEANADRKRIRPMTPDERREYLRAYRAANAERIREQNSAYRAAHREERREYERAYRAAHPDIRAAQQRRWRENGGREYMRAYMRAKIDAAHLDGIDDPDLIETITLWRALVWEAKDRGIGRGRPHVS